MRFKPWSIANLQAERLGSTVKRMPLTRAFFEPTCKPMGSFFSAKEEGATFSKNSKISETVRFIIKELMGPPGLEPGTFRL